MLTGIYLNFFIFVSKTIGFILCFHQTVYAYSEVSDSIILFFGKEIEIPSECQYDTNKLICGDEFIVWFDISEIPESLRESFSESFMKRLGETDEEHIKCIFFEEEVGGRLAAFKPKSGISRFNLYLLSQLNGIPIIMHVGLLNRPKLNSDLPEFVRSFIQIKE